jgi:hypothetical protein
MPEVAVEVDHLASVVTQVQRRRRSIINDDRFKPITTEIQFFSVDLPEVPHQPPRQVWTVVRGNDDG